MRKSQVTEYIECGHCFECGGIDEEWVELLIHIDRLNHKIIY